MTAVTEVFYPWVETGNVLRPTAIIVDHAELLCAS